MRRTIAYLLYSLAVITTGLGRKHHSKATFYEFASLLDQKAKEHKLHFVFQFKNVDVLHTTIVIPKEETPMVYF